MQEIQLDFVRNEIIRHYNEVDASGAPDLLHIAGYLGNGAAMVDSVNVIQTLICIQDRWKLPSSLDGTEDGALGLNAQKKFSLFVIICFYMMFFIYIFCIVRTIFLAILLHYQY